MGPWLTAARAVKAGSRWGVQRLYMDLLAALEVREDTTVSRVDGQDLIGKPNTRAGIRSVYAPNFPRDSLTEHVQDQLGRNRDRLLFTARDGATPLHATVLREAHVKGRRGDRPTDDSPFTTCGRPPQRWRPSRAPPPRRSCRCSATPRQPWQ